MKICDMCGKKLPPKKSIAKKELPFYSITIKKYNSLLFPEAEPIDLCDDCENKIINLVKILKKE